MCGHVGIAGKLEYKDEKTMKILLMQDYFRGPDSTGLATIRTNGDVKIAKVASHPIDLFGTKKFDDALKGYGSSAFIGHNRFATKGAINGYNAHPYTFGAVTGAHNGTLDKSSWDALDEATGEKHDVDSMAIIDAIDKLGIEETVSLLQGAWALVWFDMRDLSLNFLRNSQRPLWYAIDKGYDKIMWASEWPMMQAATQLQGDPKDYERWTNPEGYQYFSFNEDWHFRFDINDLLKVNPTEPPKAHLKERKGKPPAPVTTHYTGYGYQHGRRVGGTASDPFNRTTTGGTTPGTNTTTTITASDNNKGSGFPIHLVGSDDDPTAGYYSKEEFEALAKNGCSWCQADIEYGDKGVTIETVYEAILCADCSGNNDVTKIFCVPERMAS